MGGLFNQAVVLIIFVLGHGCVGHKYGWKPKKEFDFQVNGRSVVGLSQIGHHAGFEYTGKITVQSVKEDTLHLKLTEFSYKNVRNTTVLPLPVTSATVAVNLAKSEQPRLLLPAGLADWEINFIKGLVSSITVFHGRDQGPNYKNEDPLEENMYSIVEDTVVGRCQVLYVVNPKEFNTAGDADYTELCRGQKVVEVTKTVNYSNCEGFNEDSYGIPFGYKKHEGSFDSNIFNRASLTRLTGCGTKKSFLLLSSISESKIISKLHRRNSESVVSSTLNVKLRSMNILQQYVVLDPNYETVSGLQYHYQCQDESSRNFGRETYRSEEYGEGSARGRRKRSLANGRKLVTSTPSRRPTHDEEVESAPTAYDLIELNLADSTSCAPYVRPYTQFFLAHRFALSCNGSAPTAYAKVKLNRMLDEIAADLGDAATVVDKNTLEKISIATDYARLLSLQDLQQLSRDVFENLHYPEYETRDAIKSSEFKHSVEMADLPPLELKLKKVQ